MTQWRNVKAVWEEDSDPSNPGWVLEVEQRVGDGEWGVVIIPVAPPVTHLERDVEENAIAQMITSTAAWEGAEVVR